MDLEYINLGDILQTFANELGYSIKDEALLNSLKGIHLTKTKGLKILYANNNPTNYPIPTISSQELLELVNKEEEEFNKFWNLYDKKANYTKCFAKWRKLSKKDKDKINETLPHYLKFTPDKQFRKLPETYLNQRVWEDELYLPWKEQVVNKQTTNAFKF